MNQQHLYWVFLRAPSSDLSPSQLFCFCLEKSFVCLTKHVVPCCHICRVLFLAANSRVSVESFIKDKTERKTRERRQFHGGVEMKITWKFWVNSNLDFDIRNINIICIYHLKSVTKVGPFLSSDDTETLMHVNYSLSRLLQRTLYWSVKENYSTPVISHRWRPTNQECTCPSVVTISSLTPTHIVLQFPPNYCTLMISYHKVSSW